MGNGTFSSADYRTFSSSTVGKTTDQIYASRSMDKALDPHGVKTRESRDSAANPNATPIIVGLDVTGSMGMLADVIAREGLGTLFEGIISRKSVPDPHVMFMGIGDVKYDRAPLQVSQFEAEVGPITDQLTKLYLEHGGGGNNSESYTLPWYFAAMHTSHDSYDKRGKRGYLFTIGDEEVPSHLGAADITRFVGDTPETDMTNEQLLALVQRKYDVFHVVVEEGSHYRAYPDRVRDSWTQTLGQRVIFLRDHKLLAETIVSAIEVAEGRDANVSASGWGKGAATVYEAVRALPASRRARLPGAAAAKA